MHQWFAMRIISLNLGNIPRDDPTPYRFANRMLRILLELARATRGAHVLLLSELRECEGMHGATVTPREIADQVAAATKMRLAYVGISQCYSFDVPARRRHWTATLYDPDMCAHEGTTLKTSRYNPGMGHVCAAISRIVVGSRRVDIVNVHVPPLQQARTYKWLAGLAGSAAEREPDVPFVIQGDFNSFEERNLLECLRKHFIVDDNTEPTFHGYPHDKFQGLSCLDHCCIRPSRRAPRILSCVPLRSPASPIFHKISDHAIMRTDLAL